MAIVDLPGVRANCISSLGTSLCRKAQTMVTARTGTPLQLTDTWRRAASGIQRLPPSLA